MSVATGSGEAAGGAGGGGGRVFFQSSPREGSATPGTATAAAGQVQQQRRHQQGKVTVKYDRKELRKRLVLEEWIVEQLGQLYGCEVLACEEAGRVAGLGFPSCAHAPLPCAPHRPAPGGDAALFRVPLGRGTARWGSPPRPASRCRGSSWRPGGPPWRVGFAKRCGFDCSPGHS